jgi:hypothetical protein
MPSSSTSLSANAGPTTSATTRQRRWAHNLGDHEAEEIERFIRYYEETAERSAAVLAADKAIAE